MTKTTKVTQWIWYPWLVSLFPIIFLYSNNFGKVYTDEFLASCGVALVATSLLVGIFSLIVHDTYKAGAMTLALLIPFFAYGPLIAVITDGRPGALNKLLPVKPLVIGLAVAAVLVAAVAVWLSANRAKKITAGLNIVTGVLVVFNLGTLTVAEIQHLLAVNSRTVALAAEVRAPKVNNDRQSPDVYYFILDAYPSNSSLMDESRIDNSGFTDALEERGFYVAYDSLTNYPATLPSKSSSLNMRYLEQGEGPDRMPGIEYARRQIADNEISRVMLARGYTYIFMMSGFDTHSTIADLNVDYYTDGIHYFRLGQPQPAGTVRESFWPLLIDSTPLVEADLDLGGLTRSADVPAEYLAPGRVLAVLDEAARVAKMPEATFAVFHIILPHYPIRFARDGSVLTGEALRLARDQNRRQAFSDQLVWFNGRILQMVDDIISSSSTPPIIIIQADHGSSLGAPLPDHDARIFKILNAYYFPNGGDKKLTHDITPVNSFRLMLNTYFGADYDILENRYFRVPRRYENLFDFVEMKNP